jgi:hypothetical protein
MILVLVAVVTAVIGDLKDTAVILAIVVLNASSASSRNTGPSRPWPP